MRPQGVLSTPPPSVVCNSALFTRAEIFSQRCRSRAAKGVGRAQQVAKTGPPLMGCRVCGGAFWCRLKRAGQERGSLRPASRLERPSDFALQRRVNLLAPALQVASRPAVWPLPRQVSRGVLGSAFWPAAVCEPPHLDLRGSAATPLHPALAQLCCRCRRCMPLARLLTRTAATLTPRPRNVVRST